MYFLQQLVTGLSIGLVYGGLSLAIALVYKGGGAINVAQGELATTSALLASSCIAAGLSWPLTLLISLVGSFVVGTLVFHLLIRPVLASGPVTVLVVTVALSLLIDAVNGSVWGFLPRTITSPFGSGAVHLGSVVITDQQLGMAGLIFLMLACAGAFFRFTLVGLKMRAATTNAASARLLGLHVTGLLGLGWGLAALFGAAVGVSSAPLLGLDPTVFLNVLMFAFAGAVLGGMDSLAGSALGGVIVGVVATLLGAYVPAFGSQLNVVPPFVVMLGVLLIRPSGLFGRGVVGRV